MEKKTAGTNAQQRIYMLGRFRKAVKWASLFSQLCSVKGDSRTSLEAEAYASYMKGALFFEQDKNIDAAMINFKNTRFVEFCLFQDIRSLEPNIVYCVDIFIHCSFLNE